MAKYAGKIICPKCGEELEWEYIEPKRMSDYNYDVETLDENKLHPHRINSHSSQDFLFRAICQHCSESFIFSHTKNSDV